MNNSMLKPLEWRTESRLIKELVPLSINPRKISEAKLAKLIEKMQKFNVVTLPEIDADGTLLSWHQRLKAMMAMGRGEETIEVRVPNRKLTTQELKEWNLISNSHDGEFDMDLMDEYFSDMDFESIGFEMPTFTMPDLAALGNPDASGTPDNTKDTPPQYEADYSHKNKEIDIDSLEEDMTFKLKMSKDEYFDLQERLNVVCAKQGVETMTQAVFELLNFYERHEQ